MRFKLTSLRPSRNRAGERPPRRSPLQWFVTPKGRVFLVVLVALLFTADVRAATPPDPLTKAYGKPSAVYTKKRGRYLLLCQLWEYSRGGIPALTIERCITYGIARANTPKTGPAS